MSACRSGWVQKLNRGWFRLTLIISTWKHSRHRIKSAFESLFLCTPTEINQMREKLFDVDGSSSNGSNNVGDKLALPEPVGPVVQRTEKIYVPVKEYPEVCARETHLCEKNEAASSFQFVCWNNNKHFLLASDDDDKTICTLVPRGNTRTATFCSSSVSYWWRCFYLRAHCATLARNRYRHYYHLNVLLTNWRAEKKLYAGFFYIVFVSRCARAKKCCCLLCFMRAARRCVLCNEHWCCVSALV